MADLSVTAASVLQGTGANVRKETRIAAATITAGQAVYVNASGQLELLDRDLITLTSVIVGMALNGASAGQPVEIQTAGDYTHGAAAVTAGMMIMNSATAGGITTDALTTGQWGVFLGPSTSTTKMTIQPVIFGVAKA